MGNDQLEKEVDELKKRIDDLETLPYRCCVCGKPTDGYVQILWFSPRPYCRKHYPAIP